MTPKLNPIILPLIRKIRINLPHIPLQYHSRILLHLLLTILIMIHPLLTVAFDDVAAEETYGFVGDLTFAGALFNGLEIFYWVFGTAEAILG
jgi:hypothetical protein